MLHLQVPMPETPMPVPLNFKQAALSKPLHPCNSALFEGLLGQRQ